MSNDIKAPMRSDHTVTSADGTPISYQTMGSGPGFIVLGGSLRTSHDYQPLAATLTGSFTVHVVDRRGRGASGPQGSGYSLAKEVEDLRAVQAQTGARVAFGHSYGGLVILETARLHGGFDRVAIYEPGVPCAPVPTGWMEPYRQRMEADDPYGAFVHFIRGSGGAPAFMAKMPYWYLRFALRVGFRGPSWQRMRPLLGASLAEHRELAAQQGKHAEFAAVTTSVLILCGSRTAPAFRAEYDTLRDTLPNATLETLDRLNHFGPEGKTAPIVGGRVLAFMR